MDNALRRVEAHVKIFDLDDGLGHEMSFYEYRVFHHGDTEDTEKGGKKND
jgi:hypothetical protein